MCSKRAALAMGGHQHVGCRAGCLSTGRHGACRKTCHDGAGTGAGFTCRAVGRTDMTS